VAPVRGLIREHKKWYRVAISTCDEEMVLPAPISKDAKKLFSCSKVDAQDCITELAGTDPTASLQSKAQSKAYLATIALKAWGCERSADSIAKSGAGVQKFLCTLGDFLQGFVGIAEIVKAADQQFGGLAYGTVVLLATVAVNKKRREESIEGMLAEIAYAFPRLNTLQELRPEQGLRRLIVDVFELAIRFCRETIDYFTAPSVRRIKKAIGSRELKMETSSQLRPKLVEVRNECEVMMLRELKDARMALEEMKIRLEGI
jgi:hypothetical protein